MLRFCEAAPLGHWLQSPRAVWDEFTKGSVLPPTAVQGYGIIV
jgi:hypothetical protein